MNKNWSSTSPERRAEEERELVCRQAHADENAVRKEYLFQPPAPVVAFLRRSLMDQRDLPLAYLLWDMCVTMVPAAAAIWIWSYHSHLVGAAYLLASYAAYLQRFMLTLHFSEHRPLFKPEWRVLNLVCPYLLAPLVGLPPGMYRLHHCIMHHGGSNAWGQDASSTERFQRDSLWHFLIYWLRFALGSWVELPLVAARKRRPRLLAACLACEAAYLGGGAALLRVAPVPALWTLALPFVVSSLALMFGNWSQHVFLDPARPRSSLSMAYNCVACPDNQHSYNDGYHAMHHAKPMLHWTELPQAFRNSLDEQAAAGTLVFRGLGFFDVGLAVVLGRYRFLANHLARISPSLAAASDLDIERMLRARLVPITVGP